MLSDSREGLIRWLSEFVNRDGLEILVGDDGWAFRWDARALTDWRIVTREGLLSSKTPSLSRAEKRALISRWEALSAEEQEEAFTEGCRSTHLSFVDDGDDEGRPGDHELTISEDGKQLGVCFEWFPAGDETCLALTAFKGRSLQNERLFAGGKPFKEWATKDLYELCAYLDRITRYAEEGFAEATVLREVLEALPLYFEDRDEAQTKVKNHKDLALETLRSMSARTWRRDRERLLNLLGDGHPGQSQ